MLANIDFFKFGRLVIVCVSLALLSPSMTLAEVNAYPKESPHFAIKETVDKLVKVLSEDKEKLKADPKGFEKVVVDLIVPLIDFEEISKKVMGKTHYLAASSEQRVGFQEVFKNSLISTYSSGLAIFDSQEIVVLPPKKGTENNPKQSVNMEVKTSDGTVFPLRFSAKRNEVNQWKVVNVLLNGVNVGKAYSSHFSETMIKYNNDLDLLIQNWNANIITEDNSSSEK